MRISRESRFVRWCWWYSDWSVPCQSSICELFWRGFVIAPLLVCLALTFLAVVGLLIYVIATIPMALWVVAGLVTAVGLPLVAIFLKRKLLGCPSRSIAWEVITERAKAAKSKLCPLVDLD